MARTEAALARLHAELGTALLTRTALAESITKVDAGLTQASNALDAHRAGLTAFARVTQNAVRMMKALLENDIDTLFRCRADHANLERDAQAALDRPEVEEHIRLAWRAVETQWTPALLEAVSRAVARHELRAQVEAMVARQAELDSLVARMVDRGPGLRRGPNGEVLTPASTRVTAGILILLELAHLTLDVYTQYKAESAAADQRKASDAREALAIMEWWMGQDVLPRIALAASGAWNRKAYKVVYDEDQALARRAATEPTRPNGVPEFDMVVVTGVPGADLRRLVYRQINQLVDLEDWARFNTSLPGEPAFKKFDTGWGVRLWSRPDDAYRYTAVDGLQPGLSADLDRLHAELTRLQVHRFVMATTAAPGEPRVELVTVEDTAWFGEKRRVIVYGPGKQREIVDFGSVRPRFVRKGTVTYPAGSVAGPVVLLQAADIPTYQKLAEHYWVEQVGESRTESGNVPVTTVQPNIHGYAYVEEKHLEPTL